MSYYELLQVIAASSSLTLALAWLLRTFWRRAMDGLQRLLPPRYLKSRSVHRRTSRRLPASTPHE
ncbi:cellulose biosynthesis protein BcsF [Pseudomonas citri]|uniref:cellulose biosynthesis protein BcsF n=1 Tax=Pseudomonas citri TaxID=2978349 RepID=UPI0021B667C3|nr:cellulose biosynthesis protein BcsF [Pseudomonas citri]